MRLWRKPETHSGPDVLPASGSQAVLPQGGDAGTETLWRHVVSGLHVCEKVAVGTIHPWLPEKMGWEATDPGPTMTTKPLYLGFPTCKGSPAQSPHQMSGAGTPSPILI
jgi:hypothetical protein